MAEGALSHLRVIDLTQGIAGPYCTKLMAGFGADVVKIEPPGAGDSLRSTGPFYRDEENTEASIPFLWLNTGKKSITLNLNAGAGQAIFKQLVGDADAVIESFPPGAMPGLGLGYEVLKAINPRLVMTSISNFGQTGPYRDYEAEEITAYAMSGQMYLTGDADKEPLAAGPAITQYTAGSYAYIGSLMALFGRGAGQGQHVEVSTQECNIQHIEIAMMNYLRQGTRAKRGKHMMVPWSLYPCRDGYAAVIGGPFRHWPRAAAMFEEPQLLDPAYRHIRGRIDSREEIEALLQPWLDRHNKKEVFLAGQERHLAYGYLADFDEVFESPQHRSRGFFESSDHPVVGKHEYCAAPFKLSGTPWRQGRAPCLGEHTVEVLTERLGYTPLEILQLQEEGVV